LNNFFFFFFFFGSNAVFITNLENSQSESAKKLKKIKKESVEAKTPTDSQLQLPDISLTRQSSVASQASNSSQASSFLKLDSPTSPTPLRAQGYSKTTSSEPISSKAEEPKKVRLYISKTRHSAPSEGELSFEAGQEITLIKKTSKTGWECKIKGNTEPVLCCY
jgi:hypothetical protein